MNMVEVKVADLVGPALDWAVAVCEGIPPSDLALRWGGPFRYLRDDDGKLNGRYMTGPDLLFSRKWEAGGPIMYRERIGYIPSNGHRWDQGVAFMYRPSQHDLSIEDAMEHRQIGPTQLVAAMRCFVASRKGDTVQVPAELWRHDG